MTGLGTEHPPLAPPAIPVLQPPPEREQEPELDVAGMLAAEWARELLLTASASAPRALQAALGPSELGTGCDRRMAYRLAGAPVANLADPLKSAFGSGFHAHMQSELGRLGRGRYLTEMPVAYRGVAGHIDVYDLAKRRVIDWKTSGRSNIARYRRTNPPRSAQVQINIYAAGAQAAGLRVDEVVLMYVPRDGELSGIYAWAQRPDPAMADEAVDRYQAIESRMEAGEGPSAFDPWPSALCKWCPNFNPAASDLDAACPGEETR